VLGRGYWQRLGCALPPDGDLGAALGQLYLIDIAAFKSFGQGFHSADQWLTFRIVSTLSFRYQTSLFLIVYCLAPT
jgi:hypothetical protein